MPPDRAGHNPERRDEEPDETVELVLSTPYYLTIADDGSARSGPTTTRPLPSRDPIAASTKGHLSASPRRALRRRQGPADVRVGLRGRFHTETGFASHQYPDDGDGEYTMTLTVRDSSGRAPTRQSNCRQSAADGGLSGGRHRSRLGTAILILRHRSRPRRLADAEYWIDWGDTQTQNVTGGIAQPRSDTRTRPPELTRSS